MIKQRDSDSVPRPGEPIHESREAIPPPADGTPTDASELAPETKRPPPGGINDPEHQEIVRVIELRIDRLAESFLGELAELRACVQTVLDDAVSGHELRRSHEHLSLRVNVLEAGAKQGNSGSMPAGK